MSIAEQRRAAVAEAVSRIREIEAMRGISPASLSEMRDVLYRLAERNALFPREDFPPPTDGATNIRYLLSEGDASQSALYMNSIVPGKRTDPHNHTTWAIVVSVEGEEINRFYKRLEGGTQPGKATLALSHEVVVAPGVGVTMMPDDIHSIAVEGTQPTLHLHMYGRAIETLTERLGYDLEEGTCDFYRLQGRSAQ